MKPMYLVAITVVLIAAHFIITQYIKRKLVNDITKAMTENNFEEFYKLIFSKRAVMFLDPNMLFLLRSSYYVMENNIEEAAKAIKVINPKKLTAQYIPNYYTNKVSVQFAQKDMEAYGKTLEELRNIKTDENAKMIDMMIAQFEVNRRLNVDFDPKIIKELEEIAEESDGQNQGVAYLNLAKAYHLNKDEKKCKATLKKAEKLLKDSLYLPMIEEALKDTSILDN